MSCQYNDIDYDDFDEPLFKVHGGKLLKGIYDYGFNKPSPIQSKTIQPIKDGKDLIAQSPSGSGKTGAFIIGVLLKIICEEKYPQALVLANTRELAMQIHTVTKEISQHMNIGICLCIGGVENNNTIEKNNAIAKQSHVLIGTPGRLNGLINMFPNIIKKIKILIFDEADQLLSKDFIEQIQSILKNVPSSTQICLFSATSNSENVQNTKENFMNNPVEIYVKKEQIKLDLVKNYVIDAENEKNKFDILLDLYNNINICQAVIFVNSVNHAIQLARKLKDSGHTAIGLIHGQLTDSERINILKKFRNTLIRILIATDIMARGIDIQTVGLVINYDIPNGDGFEEQYIHRVGRSGRYGKLGVAINIMTNNKYEWTRIKNISEKYDIQFDNLVSLQKICYYLSGINGYNYKDTNNEENEENEENENNI